MYKDVSAINNLNAKTYRYNILLSLLLDCDDGMSYNVQLQTT